MSLTLKVSTTTTISVGPFLDKTDGITEETSLSVVVELSKNGGVFAARNSATAITHDAEGWYRVELNTTDTNTLGRLVVKAHDSANHLPVWHEFMVMSANVFDSAFGSGSLAVDLTSVIADTDDIQSRLTTLQADTDDIQTRLPATLVAGRMSSDATAISGSTVAADNLELAFTGAAYNAAGLRILTADTATALGAQAKLDVNQEVDTALIDTKLDRLLLSAVIGTDVTDNSVVARIASKSAVADWDSFNNTTDSLEALRDYVSSATALSVVSGQVTNVQADTDNLQTRLPTTLVGGRMVSNAEVVEDKTGYALATDGLDSIPIVDPGGVASTFPNMLVQLWRRFFKKADITTTTLKTYGDDGSTVRTTQTVSDTSGTQTQGAAT